MQHSIHVRSIMRKFAAATGLSDPSVHPRRYLWTDAFAVCNYLSLYRLSGEQSFLQQALVLVDQVHLVLGHHRKDSDRTGWLSGYDDEHARLHPTEGGLRIGKELDERQPGEPVNESLEWHQDGQYFHYLTKWMHALDCVSRDTNDAIYNRWALELARVAHSAFVYTPPTGGAKRMYWKMSADLSRPLVTSMGQHDPLDGWITYQQLRATARRFPDTPRELMLDSEIEEMATMCAGRTWVTHDALGVGGLLTDAYKLLQLIDSQYSDETERLEGLLNDSDRSLREYAGYNQLDCPAGLRLAFRELGLAIGLQTISKMQRRVEERLGQLRRSDALIALLNNLSSYLPIGKEIQKFWMEPGNQSVASWKEHADINNVMLATCLAPDGYLLPDGQSDSRW